MDETEYQTALTDLEKLRATGFFSAFRFVGGASRTSRALARSAGTLADHLARIDPPPDVEPEHRALMNALRRVATELDELARRKGLSPRERFIAISEVDFATAEARALETKGYRLPTAVSLAQR
jgi:hypothetical protein